MPIYKMEEKEDRRFDQRPAAVAGFWRRTIAYCIIDAAVLAVPGYAIAYLFLDSMIALGGWGRLVGYGISLLYFGFMDSRAGGGRSLGKRVAKIKVVTATGGFLTIPQTGLRYTILELIILPVAPSLLVDRPADLLYLGKLGVASVSMGVTLTWLYLLVFNRRTRQSLHDLAVGAYVVKANSAGPVTALIWKRHYAVIAVLFLSSTVLTLVFEHLAQEHMADSVRIENALDTLPGVQSAHVASASSREGKATQIKATVSVDRRGTNFNALANQVAQVILTRWPAASEMDSIRVTVSCGFDIGIASASWDEFSLSISPSEWNKRIEPQPT